MKFVVNSIKKFGFNVPIIIDKNNVIICGHTRFKAAQNLGLKTIPCIKKDELSDKQIKAFRIADNKIHERSNWADDLLKIELEELKNIGFEPEELGFLDFEIDTIFQKEINIDDFFEEGKSISKEPKRATCPHCGEIFAI